MNNQICDSIKGKNIIEFLYEGGNRVVEPHCYGIHKQTENEVLCGYQISGYSQSGNIPDWRLYDVSKITGLKITEKIFSKPRQYYNPNDKRMSKIFCNI